MTKPMLRDYQIRDLAFHLANPKSLNLSDPGTGKTPTVCVLFYYWWKRKGWKTVWAMPKSLMDKNKEELIRFTEFEPDDIAIMESDHATLTKSWTGPTITRQKKIRSMRITINGKATTAYHFSNDNQGVALVQSVPLVDEQGPGWLRYGAKAPERTRPTQSVIFQPLNGPDGKPMFDTKIREPEVAKDLIAAAADAKVFICTFAFLRNHWERLLATIPEIKGFGVDELHMGYGTPSSEQTTSFYHVNDHCEGFVGMTGTLIDGRLDSAFPAIHAIEPRYYGGLPGFIGDHALWINDYGKVESWKNEEKIKAILERHAIRHSFEEVYGDEPVHFETVWVDMLAEQRKQYELFHEQAMLELEDGRVLDGTLPGVAVIRATQIMAHPETMGLAKGEITAKDRKVMEYANEGRPMLLFSASQPEQERLIERLEGEGLKAGLINANVSGAGRAAIDRDFRNGKLDAIVGSGPTVAVGYNWERADHVVGVSWDYKDVNFVQAYRRASRGSRTTVLRVTTLAYNDSIDGRKLNILTSKSMLANRVDESRRVLRFA